MLSYDNYARRDPSVTAAQNLLIAPVAPARQGSSHTLTNSVQIKKRTGEILNSASNFLLMQFPRQVEITVFQPGQMEGRQKFVCDILQASY